MADTQLQKILTQLEDHEKRIHVLETVPQPSKQKTVLEEKETSNSDDLTLSIVNKIGECDESEEIQSKILDQTGIEGKILLCFFISQKYFKNAWLTTGNIEKITSASGSKIAVSNVSNKIKGQLRQYLENGAVRKRGQPTPYRLNRKGIKRFNEIIHVTEK